MCLKKEKKKIKLYGLNIFISKFCNKPESKGCWISSMGNISNEYKVRVALWESREYSNCKTGFMSHRSLNLTQVVYNNSEVVNNQMSK